MATESIGTLIPTAIPGYTDSADIQAALRAYHYGSYSYDPANTSPGSLITPSIAKTIYDIQADITTLENRPSSGGEVNATEPVPGDFTPPSIPDGFIWVDSDGSTGNGPYSATSVFTNSAPTANLTTGVIWVDKDPTTITNNPFIPQAIIGAKGDIVVGTANDTASILSVGTNGFVLKANSATTSGLEWSTDNSYSTPTIGSTAITSGATVTTIAGLTLSKPILAAPIERTSISASAATGTVTIDVNTASTLYITASSTSNWALNVRGDGSTTLNSLLTTGDAITVAFLATQGSTAYYNTSLQIDGTTSGVTLEWQGGTAPAAGNVSGIDSYVYNIIKTASATYTVLASQTKFA